MQKTRIVNQFSFIQLHISLFQLCDLLLKEDEESMRDCSSSTLSILTQTS